MSTQTPDFWHLVDAERRKHYEKMAMFMGKGELPERVNAYSQQARYRPAR